MENLAQDNSAVADCITADGEFSAPVQNPSPTSVFVITDEPLSVGQEIAMTIRIPRSGDTIKATGQIVNTTSDGVDVEFKILFNR